MVLKVTRGLAGEIYNDTCSIYGQQDAEDDISNDELASQKPNIRI